MVSRLAAAVTLSIALLALSTKSLRAQQVVLRAPSPGSITGVVTDTVGTPLADVDVFMAKLQRRTRTRFDGTFQFDSLKPGRYELSARRLGYVASAHDVVVTPRGESVQIQMIQIGFVLPSMISRADRGGLSGIIGDTAYRAMADVEVRVMGSGHHATTDSTGAFWLPLKPGRYMVTLSRPGFAQQLVGVTVPDDEGRKIAAWMVESDVQRNPQMGANLFEFNQRVMMASPVWSKFFTREDMEKRGLNQVQELVNMMSMKRVPPDCMIRVNGGPRRVPLWELSAADIEFVEVYISSPSRQTQTSLNGNATTLTTSTSRVPAPAAADAACGVSVIAWLRN